jgi:hypothetical protein
MVKLLLENIGVLRQERFRICTANYSDKGQHCMKLELAPAWPAERRGQTAIRSHY